MERQIHLSMAARPQRMHPSDPVSESETVRGTYQLQNREILRTLDTSVSTLGPPCAPLREGLARLAPL
jgi:hypothetical protein